MRRCCPSTTKHRSTPALFLQQATWRLDGWLPTFEKSFLPYLAVASPGMAGIWLGVSQRYLDWRAGSRYRERDLWHYGLQLLHHCRPGYWACGPGSVDENTNIGACLSCLAKKTADFGFSAFRTLLGARWCKPGFWGGAVKTESDDQILNKAYYDTAMQSLCQASGSGSIKQVAWFRRGPWWQEGAIHRSRFMNCVTRLQAIIEEENRSKCVN